MFLHYSCPSPWLVKSPDLVLLRLKESLAAYTSVAALGTVAGLLTRALVGKF